MKKFNYTKKKIKLLKYKLNWSHDSVGLKRNVISRLIIMQRMYLFFLLNRTYLKRYYGYYRERKFRKIHKILFKKRKRRLYGQGYLHTMERMSGNMLYRSRLVSKLKHVKQLLVNNKVFVNGKFIKGYSKKFKPLDVIHFFDINDKYFYLHSYFGVILDKSSKFFIENNLFVFIVKYSRVFGYICLFIIRSRCSLYMGNCRVFGAVYTYLVQENVFFRKLWKLLRGVFVLKFFFFYVQVGDFVDWEFWKYIMFYFSKYFYKKYLLSWFLFYFTSGYGLLIVKFCFHFLVVSVLQFKEFHFFFLNILLKSS